MENEPNIDGNDLTAETGHNHTIAKDPKRWSAEELEAMKTMPSNAFSEAFTRQYHNDVEEPKYKLNAHGLFHKYNVSRVDGQDVGPGDKHYGCDLFVLDLTHDPFAKPAILAYANACQAEYPALAEDLFKKAGHIAPITDCIYIDDAEAFAHQYQDAVEATIKDMVDNIPPSEMV